MRKSPIILLVSFFAVSSLQAGGFHLYEFGGRASAMGGAVVARAWDGSTIFYNPAGLAYLNGTQFYGGATLIFPTVRFVGVAPVFGNQHYDTKDNFFAPINLYFSHKFNDKLAAGIGVANPFGLGVEWYDDFPGRGYSKNSQLQSFYISPVIAYRIIPKLSIGGGPDFVISKVKLERNVFLFSGGGTPGYEVGEVALEGTSDLGVGFTASAMYRSERLGLGFIYRHSIQNQINDGNAEFTIYDNLSVPNAAVLAQELLQNQGVSTTIDFPNYLSAGIYYKVSNRFGVEADYVWFNWSVFNEIALDFEKDHLDQTMPEEYQDSWQARLGVHYELSNAISVRAGYAYDKTPQPIQTVSPLLPDDTRHDLSFGLGYNFGKYQLDLGYMLVDLGERSTVENGEGMNHHGFDGTYNSRADLFFANFGISF